MNIVFIAPPAAGKGTQAEILEKEMNLYHLSTGDLLREISNSNTELGKEVKELIDNGKLIDDDLMLKLLKEKLSTVQSNGIIFDGFPRTIKQATMLNELLESMNQKVDKVIYLEVDKETAKKRATGRITCNNCGSIYNIYFDNIVDNKCNNCGQVLTKRNDDTEEKFNNRFDTYMSNTKPVIDYYKDLNILYTVSSIGDKLEIYNNIKSVIEEK
jgi:adenylate kinase